MGKQYHEEGYEIFVGAMAPYLPVLRQAVDSECRRLREGKETPSISRIYLADYIRSKPERSPGVTPEDVGNEPYTLDGIAGISDAFRSVLGGLEMWEIAADLLALGPDELVYHYGQVVRKPARIGPALGWHRDFGATYISTAGSRFLRLLVPLQSMSKANGGTAVVPYSHLLPDDAASALVGQPETGEGAICPEMQAGDLLALHPKTLHGGGPNRSELDRDVLVVQFAGANAPLLHTDNSEPYTQQRRSAFLAPQGAAEA